MDPLPPQTALVTGACSFAGSWLVRRLLEDDFLVRASINVEDAVHDVPILSRAFSDHPSLFYAEVDPMEEQSLADAMEGVDYVFHCDNACDLREISDEDAQVVQPVRQSTLALLHAANRTTSVSKVIFLSCCSAMMYSPRLPEDRFTISENSWSDEALLRSEKKWYHLSKYVAEKTAWDFMAKGDRNFGLFVLVPGMMFGPPLTPILPYSLDWLRSAIQGEKRWLPRKRIPVVDVRDAATAMVLLAVKGQYQTRYVCVSQVIRDEEFFEMLKQYYPRARVPTEPGPSSKDKIGVLQSADIGPISALGILWTPVNDTLCDTVEGLQAIHVV